MKRNQVLFEDYFLRKEILRVAKLFRVPCHIDIMQKEPYRQQILTSERVRCLVNDLILHE